MRTNGVAERLCTGDASDRENLTPGRRLFRTLSATRYTTGRTSNCAVRLVSLANCFLRQLPMKSGTNVTNCWRRITSPRGIMQQMNVKMVGTTDDPIDSLEHHAEIAKDGSFTIKVLPSWRPDKAFNIEQATFNDYMAKLGEVSDTDIRRFADLQTALTKRLDHFAAHGCKCLTTRWMW